MPEAHRRRVQVQDFGARVAVGGAAPAAPYFVSPTIGWPAAARCARTWWGRPAESRTRSSAVAARRSITSHSVSAASGCRPPPTRTRAPRRPTRPIGRGLAARIRGRAHHLGEVGLLAAVGGQRGAQLRPDARAARGDQHAAGAGVEAMHQSALARIGRRVRAFGEARDHGVGGGAELAGRERVRRHARGLGDRDQRVVLAEDRQRDPRVGRDRHARRVALSMSGRRQRRVVDLQRRLARRRAWRPCAVAGRRCGPRPPAASRRAAATLSPGMAAATA